MELKKIVRVIGSLIVASLIVAMPFLCALSFAFNWFVYIKVILTIITLGILSIGTLYIYDESED